MNGCVLAIGSSTGGVKALEQVLPYFPTDGPAVVVVQHMPKNFTKAFAERLNRICPMHIKEAVQGDVLRRGVALIAPGGSHMKLKRRGARVVVELDEGSPVHHQRPSVDVLFHSLASVSGRTTVAAILTGMGGDGAAGLLAIRRAGGRTIAQDQRSCVVFGMPQRAIAIGAAEQVLPLRHISREMLMLASKNVE